MPLVSVIMPVYNGENYLAEAIESILGQTFTDFEFIIVDDGSQDGSGDILRDYQKRDARIHLICLEKNEGHGGARNHGIRAAGGQYIAAMDGDDVCLPERLEKQVDFMRRNPDIGVLGAGAQAVDEKLRSRYTFDLPERHALIVYNIFVASFLIHPTVMMRRELLESVGGYARVRRTAVDVELWSRLMWRTRFANLPETLLLYRRHPAQNHATRDDAMKEQAWEARARLLERLWGEAPRATLTRFEQMRMDESLPWLERRKARADMTRLLEAMIAAGLIDAEDRRMVAAHIQRRLEATTPRIWQKFCHWRRHRFGEKGALA